MSLTIDKLIDVENLNHPNDYTIIFAGGNVTFNPGDGPLRFWYQGDLVELKTVEDVWYLRHLIRSPRPDFYWEIDPAKRDISGFEMACTLHY